MISINGRSVVHQASGGKITTTSINYTSPDHVPIAYPNRALAKHAENTARSVFANGHALCHQSSYFSRSHGDEAGDEGGVVSGTVNGIAEFITASGDVFIEGQPAVRALDLMVSNHRNTPAVPLQQATASRHTAAPAQVTDERKPVATSHPAIVWTIHGSVKQMVAVYLAAD